VVPVCPGFVDTDMTWRTINGLMRHRGLSQAEARALVAGANESNRIIPAEEVADIVAQICSREMPVDNGEPLLIE
jgi:NAD(P)-dependent dehydrogenase (short-subunit alcohol dehydrogenase family)